MRVATGDIVKLTDATFNHTLECVVEVVGGQNTSKSSQSLDKPLSLLLALSSSPYLRMHLLADDVHFKAATPNRDNMLTFSEVVDEDISIVAYDDDQELVKVMILTTTIKTTVSSKEKPCLCLSIDRNGKLGTMEYSQAIQNSHPETNCIFLMNFQHMNSLSKAKSSSSLVSQYLLQKWQVQRFMTEGYLQIPRVLTKDVVDYYNTYLLHHIGLAGHLVPGGIQGPEYGKFPGSITNGPVIKALISHPSIKGIVEEILGDQIHNSSSNNTQVAFRYPQIKPLTSNAEEFIEWHTDGYRQGSSHSFSLLVGISLSSVENDYEGNLTVWPGSHYLLHRSRYGMLGELDIPKMNELIATEDKYSAFRSAPSKTNIERKPDNRGNILPDLGPCMQLKTTPGDIVLLHPDLAHGGSYNYSPHIRQMIYFRVKIDCGSETKLGFESWQQVIETHNQNMWCDLQGVSHRLGDQGTALHNIYY